MFKQLLETLTKQCGILTAGVIEQSSPSAAGEHYEFIAPCDGFVSCSIFCAALWISMRGHTVFESNENDENSFQNRGGTVPVKKGELVDFWAVQWTLGNRFVVAFYPLGNSA